jgi:hypothetical protein
MTWWTDEFGKGNYVVNVAARPRVKRPPHVINRASRDQWGRTPDLLGSPASRSARPSSPGPGRAAVMTRYGDLVAGLEIARAVEDSWLPP